MIVLGEDYFYYVGYIILMFLLYSGFVFCFFVFVLFKVLVWGFEKIKVFIDLVLDEVVIKVLFKVCNFGYSFFSLYRCSR